MTVVNVMVFRGTFKCQLPMLTLKRRGHMFMQVHSKAL